MDIREYISNIAQNYDRNDGTSTPTQSMLRSASTYLDEHVGTEFVIKGSGGMGTATFTPWIAVLSPNETKSVQNGLYVVYLFSSNLEKVTLSLAHGVESISKRLGSKNAIMELTRLANDIRSGLPAELIIDLNRNLQLGGGWRQKAYAAGTVVAKDYSVDSLPQEEELREDLELFVGLYKLAIPIKHSSSIQGNPVAEVEASINARQRGQRGQGFATTESRQAVEKESMAMAVNYYESHGWHVEDVSSKQSYDLRCTNFDGIEIHVEVKGTTGDGSSVLLTKNEVTHAKYYDRTVLYIVYDLVLKRDESEDLYATDGKEKIYDPFDVESGFLEAIGFKYYPVSDS
ncbi:MAG: DUF3578 domain-containing protein [SAR202 cluster bacterium]|nr:DUF3578 domain-containing protein [SAR202 cluster bacterium]